MAESKVAKQFEKWIKNCSELFLGSFVRDMIEGQLLLKMKHTRMLDPDESLDELIRRLCYGTHEPLQNQSRLFSTAVVSKYLRVNHDKVRNSIRRYFY